MFTSLSYMPKPFARFSELFGNAPETATCPDRFRSAVASSVHFDASVKALAGCQNAHNLLQIIQKEILKDAAVVAFSRAVDLLQADHDQRVIAGLQYALAVRRVEVTALYQRSAQLNDACKAAVNDCYVVESAKWRALSEERDTNLAAAEEKLATAIAFAEESGTPAEAEIAELREVVVRIKAAYDAGRSQCASEREVQVTTLKRECEAAVRPIHAEASRLNTEAERAFQEAKKQAETELRQAISALREGYEAKLQAAQAEQDALYAPLYAAERALEEAAKAFSLQMKAVRAASAQSLSAGISSLFVPAPAAAPVVEEQPADGDSAAHDQAVS